MQPRALHVTTLKRSTAAGATDVPLKKLTTLVMGAARRAARTDSGCNRGV
jgi:hypothetical protein